MSRDLITRASGASRPAVIFLHIPKAAGTTMHQILAREYRGSTVCDLDTSDLRASIAAFRQLPPAQKDRIDLLKGHLPFGLHEGFERECVYVTMLRNPVNRIVSHYRYAREHPEHYLHDVVVKGRMDLRDYVAAGLATELDNVMVRLLTDRLDDVPYGACDRPMLEAAKRNLKEHFAVAGLSEHFDESVLLMKQKLDWRRLPVYQRRKVSKLALTSEDLADSTTEYIRTANALDCELYEFASKLFHSEMQTAGDFIAKELLTLQEANARYGSLARTRDDWLLKIDRFLSRCRRQFATDE